jgi:hypothetical protein
VLGVKENTTALKNAIEIYPNPASGNFKIKFTSSRYGSNSIEINNTLGQIVLVKNFSSTIGENIYSFTTNGLPNGIYFLTLKSDTGIKCARLIVE